MNMMMYGIFKGICTVQLGLVDFRGRRIYTTSSVIHGSMGMGKGMGSEDGFRCLRTHIDHMVYHMQSAFGTL